MRYEPHDYQRYSIEYLKTHPIAALLLDCGLGKTSITLTAIADLLFDSFEVHRVLVIAPVRVAKFSWPDELEKWDHLSHLTYAVAIGTPKQRMDALKSKADITIINRENIQWLVEKSGYRWDFDMIVADEISSFKNHQSKRFRALMKVRPKVKRIAGLTATPSSNSLMDLFAEFKLLDMGERLGKFITQYRTRYFQPDKTNGQIVYSYKPLPGAEKAIYKQISDITISMRAEDHLKMPKLIRTEYPAVMDEKETEKYEETKKTLILQMEDKEITAANAAALVSKLSQLSSGAIYTDDGQTAVIHSRKLDALEDIIESANGKPILVAYWFRHERKRIEERLSQLKTPFAGLDSDDGIHRWNSEELAVGLMHPMSVGHGVNIQNGGSTIVWFSLPWSNELYTQACGRLWRQGQKAETVVVMHIMTRKTIDERILKALANKGNTQNALIEAVKAEIGEGSRK